jgi:hypothetical protein
MYYVDGVDVTEPVRSLGGLRLPYNFIREVQVRTGGYEAQYRSSLGGTINVVTYAGGNERSGQAFGYFVNDRISSEPRLGALDQDKGDFARYDLGLGLGGPILKDRLWYYFAYNPSFEREDVDVPGTGFHEDKTTSNRFAGKITWQATPRNAVVLTAIGDPTQRRAVGDLLSVLTVPVSFANPDPYLLDLHTGSVSLGAVGRHWLHDRFLLESSVSSTRYVEQRTAATERGRAETCFIDQETGQWSGGVSDYVDEKTTVVATGLKSTWMTGDHSVMAGAGYEDPRRPPKLLHLRPPQSPPPCSDLSAG